MLSIEDELFRQNINIAGLGAEWIERLFYEVKDRLENSQMTHTQEGSSDSNPAELLTNSCLHLIEAVLVSQVLQ